ncbi:ABC transporter permease [Cloacibacillus sp. An23]|uniref:ABC transporter permease n=1 Tax=Cloacibacillus sp. An23 TaxID=1965591 RepID=UPI000B3A967D|nr:ABC transporter permease [Cloacibacillus sp. An23]OUO91360.1 hypothetical protein B5F39_13020 [Cloacibacillus sp. An23]
MAGRRKLGALSIALTNLRGQGMRTGVMEFLCLVLAASLFVSSILLSSMERSVEQTVNRMGADVIVVPKSYASEYAGSLFSGEHCSFYFDGSWLDRIAAIPGVAKASPQLFIATLDASCCAMPLQIIGFDSKTDFIVTSWMKSAQMREIGRGEVIAGANMYTKPGSTLIFFGRELKVAGKLDRTDTNYDNCVFIDFSTARDILRTEQARENRLGGMDPETVISSIMIRAEDGVNPLEVARKINYTIEDSPLWAYTANSMVSKAADSVASFASFSLALNVLMLLTAAVSMICIFTVTIIQRRPEFGVMLTLGATKGYVVRVILAEGLVIGLAGGIAGIAASGGVMLAFREQILLWLGIPAFISSVGFYAATGAKCLAVAVAAGLAASACAIFAVCRGEPIALIQEKEI